MQTISSARRAFSGPPRNDEVGPGPFLVAVEAVERVGAGLDHHSKRRNDGDPREWTSIRAVQVVDEQLPERHPEAREGLELADLELHLVEEVSEPVLREAIEVPRLFVEMPDERHAVDGDTARSQDAVAFPQRSGGLFEVLEHRSAKDGVERLVFDGDVVRRRHDVDPRRIVRGVGMIDSNMLGDIRGEQRLVRLRSAADVDQATADVRACNALQLTVVEAVDQQILQFARHEIRVARPRGPASAR